MGFYSYLILGGLIIVLWLPMEWIRFMAMRRYMEIRDKSLMGKQELGDYLNREVLGITDGSSDSESIAKSIRVLKGRSEGFESVLTRPKLIALTILAILIMVTGMTLFFFHELTTGLFCVLFVLIAVRGFLTYRSVVKLQRQTIGVLESFPSETH